MKRTIIKSMLAVFVMVLVFTSCSKYEEGSPFLASTKSALCRTWSFDDYKPFGDSDHLSEYDGVTNYEEEIIIEKEGDVSIDRSFSWNGDQYRESYNGYWYFVDDKNFIRFVLKDNDGNSWANEYKIIKLKTDVMILEELDGDRLTYTSK